MKATNKLKRPLQEALKDCKRKMSKKDNLSSGSKVSAMVDEVSRLLTDAKKDAAAGTEGALSREEIRLIEVSSTCFCPFIDRN